MGDRGVGNGLIFISYRREDTRADSGRIYDHLSSRFPGRVFRDIASLEPGSEWQETIDRVLSEAAACVVVIGNAWLNIADEDGNRRLDNPCDPVRREIAIVLRRPIRIVPVLVAGAKMPRPQDLPHDLQPLCNRNGLEINEQNWAECCEKLVNVLEPAVGVRATPVHKRGQKRSSGPKKVLTVMAAALTVAIVVYIGSRKPQTKTAKQPQTPAVFVPRPIEPQAIPSRPPATGDDREDRNDRRSAPKSSQIISLLVNSDAKNSRIWIDGQLREDVSEGDILRKVELSSGTHVIRMQEPVSCRLQITIPSSKIMIPFACDP